MTMVTPGVVPASALLQGGRPSWLERWGSFASRTGFGELNRDVVERTKLVLLDTIGAIAAGAQEREMRDLVRRLAGTYGAGSGAPAIGSGTRLAPPVAAFANGTAGTMLELDEGNQYARGHPGIHVVPAALAAAERSGASGADLLLAVALGYEIGARIGMAGKLRVTMHPHGTWGTVGAALAVAKLHGADADRLIETVNVASTLGLATSRRTMLEGATVRNAYAGFSNQLGWAAYDLVCCGFVGETDGVATVYGSVSADRFDPAAMVDDLGARWEIARNYFKRHAACRYTHGALDALEAIVRQAGNPIPPEDVKAIEVDTYVWAAQLDAPAPKNMLAAKFSLPFALATALVNGRATVAAFRDDARSDERVQSLAHRVTVREDASLTAMLPGLRPARVRIHLTDGRILSAEALTNKGDTEDPYSGEEVRDKFRELAAPVWGSDQVGLLLGTVEDLENLEAGELCDLLARPSQQGAIS